jgi:hypothetical protein
VSDLPELCEIPTGDSREHLRRARELLVSTKFADLRYAALELRLCLEVMTYNKLRSFAKYLPKSFLARTWQPPQLLKAMKQLDGNADQSIILHMSGPVRDGIKPQDDEYQLVGEHKAFSLTWLRKHYNKIGFLLHLQPEHRTSDVEQRKYLSTVADEIEEAQKGGILGMWIGEAIEFRCELCGEASTVSAHYARTTGTASCLNPNCELEYLAAEEDKQIFLTPLLVKVDCKSCAQPIRVQQRHLKQGLIVPCPTCKSEHGFRCKWEYGIAAPQKAGGDIGE